MSISILTNLVTNIFGICSKLCALSFDAFLLWIYLAISIFTGIYKFGTNHISNLYFYIFHSSWPARIVKYLLNMLKQTIYSINNRTHPILQQPFLRRLRSEQHVTTIFDRASARPDEITENQKVLLLMQKMRKLQQTIFQQSVDRRKAEQDLFDLKIQFSQKSATLVKERSQSIENANKLNVLKLQLADKIDLISKSKQHIVSLQEQLKSLKQSIAMKINQNQSQDQKQKNQIVDHRSVIFQNQQQGNVQNVQQQIQKVQKQREEGEKEEEHVQQKEEKGIQKNRKKKNR